MDAKGVGRPKTGRFVEPPWDAPLDMAAELRRLDAREPIRQKGMFILPMIVEAKRRGIRLPSARERYLPFHDYPLREHVQLLIESAESFFAGVPPRQALRRLGRGGYGAFVESTVGKVVWSAVVDMHSALEGMMKGYMIAVSGCSAAVVERGPKFARIRLENVPYFLDCHHIGCLEGAMRSANVEGQIRIALESPSTAEYLVEW